MCCAYSPRGGSMALRRSVAVWCSIQLAFAYWAMTTRVPTASFACGTIVSTELGRSLRLPGRSPRLILCENIVLRLSHRMAGEAAPGVVSLWRLILQSAGSERIRRGIIFKLGISPSTTVREPLAILQHEISIMLGARHQRLTGLRFVLYRNPMDFRHFHAVRERPTVARNARLVRVDHRGVSEDHRKFLPVMTDGNGLPAFISLELGEREPIRHLNGVLVLIGNCNPGTQYCKQHANTHTDQSTFALHPRAPLIRLAMRRLLGH